MVNEISNSGVAKVGSYLSVLCKVALFVSSEPMYFVCLSYGHLRIVTYCLIDSQLYFRKDHIAGDLDPSLLVASGPGIFVFPQRILQPALPNLEAGADPATTNQKHDGYMLLKSLIQDIMVIEAPLTKSTHTHCPQGLTY